MKTTHHIDGDPRNNDPANLKMIDISSTPELLEVAEDLESWNGTSTAATAEDILAELGPILVKARAAIDKATKA